jgi:hypothetical protein
MKNPGWRKRKLIEIGSKMIGVLQVAFHCVLCLVSLCAATAAAGGSRILALETEWRSMGLMSSDQVSRHDLAIDRTKREIRHTLYINFGETVEKTFAYRMDQAACENFFTYLEDQAGISRWRNDYTIPMLDGSAWKLRVLREGAPARRIKGNEEPPGGAELERKIRALARFDQRPVIF